MVTGRPALMALTGTGLILAAGYGGLLASWTASVEYGIALTSASAVVLLLVLAYLLVLPVGLLRSRLTRGRPTPGRPLAGHPPAGRPLAGSPLAGRPGRDRP
jgi:manganese/iron transport system permease protein